MTNLSNNTLQLDESYVLSALKQAEAMLSGHFGLASGEHSETYIDKNAIYMRPLQTSEFCEAIANKFKGHEVEVVVGPATGGIILAHEVARHLTQLTDREVWAMYADKADDSFILKRGYSRFVPNKRVLVVEDIVTTGTAARKVCEVVEEHNGSVVGVGALVNRSPEKPILTQYDFQALLNYSIPTYPSRYCPSCNKGIPIDSVYGRGA